MIDDDADLRFLVARVVQQAGYSVDAVADGVAGLERLAQRLCDVIVCDLRMPRMDGVTFYDEVRRTYPGMARRIVLMTAHGKGAEYAAYLGMARAPLLNKPFTLEEFRATLAGIAGPPPAKDQDPKGRPLGGGPPLPMQFLQVARSTPAWVNRYRELLVGYRGSQPHRFVSME